MMAFAALELRSHRTLVSPALESPNLFILTDRTDLDNQIAATFAAYKLPSPVRVEPAALLHEAIRG